MRRRLVSNEPVNWKEKLKVLKTIDWRRINGEWQRVAMSGADVVNQKQARICVMACGPAAGHRHGVRGAAFTPLQHDGRLGVSSADADIREFTAGSSLRADVGIRARQFRQPKIREPERGGVVLDQPQRAARSRVLRLGFDTAALRPLTGRFANTST